MISPFVARNLDNAQVVRSRGSEYEGPRPSLVNVAIFAIAVEDWDSAAQAIILTDEEPVRSAEERAYWSRRWSKGVR